MEMQRSLAARNLYQGKIDGVWGPKTESALRNFQTQNGLEATGRLDTRSAVALGMEVSAEDAARPYLEMSGRKGLGVKADDLMDASTYEGQLS